ncbi:hypothetical protein [Halorubrum sp. C191]|nr:hypothetical protein [Halorubrum sp. C191]
MTTIYRIEYPSGAVSDTTDAELAETASLCGARVTASTAALDA